MPPIVKDLEKTMLARYKGLSVHQRVQRAVSDIVRKRASGEKVNISQTARNFGIDRANLAKRVSMREKELQQNEVKETMGRSKFMEAMAPASMFDIIEKRRVPEDFWEFDKRYFYNWTCPDCSTERGEPILHDYEDFHREIMAASYDPNIRRLLVTLPPAHAKTTLLSIKRNIHRICLNPNIRKASVSLTTDLAADILGAIQEAMTNEDLYLGGHSLIQECGPFYDDENREQEWNNQRFVVCGRMSFEKEPTFQALSIGKSIYGKRLDELDFDDVVDLDRSRNPDQVKKDLQWMETMASTRVAQSGKINWMGTRVWPGDVYSFIGAKKSTTWLKYPCIIDEESGQTLWPDHFDINKALAVKDDITDNFLWELVYQQVELPVEGLSFNPEEVEAAKDVFRKVGHIGPGWIVVGGLDPAGAGKYAGFTAAVVLGIDTATGARYLIDVSNVQQMKSPAIKQLMLDWAMQYGMSEWRVEYNGLQSQIFQFDEELRKALGAISCRMQAHQTQGGNKWDPVFGVESRAPLFTQKLVSIPWEDRHARDKFGPLVTQLKQFPVGKPDDVAMAFWIADLAAESYLRRAHAPLFHDRMRVPGRVAKRRALIRPSANWYQRVDPRDQRRGALVQASAGGMRRVGAGPIMPHSAVREFDEPEEADPWMEPGELVNL